MLRANPRVLGSALFTALGLLPLGCGGAFAGANGDGGDGGDQGSGASGGSSSGSGNAGEPSHAGTPSGGKASGGTSAMGGKPGTGGTPAKFPCLNPMKTAGGYEQCENGTVHRPSIEECPSSLPRPIAQIALPPDGGDCASDADCVAMPHGYCGSGGQLPGTFCNYGCVKDSECAAGQICVCGEPVGHCASSTCSSDAACGGSFRCQSYDASHGCGIEAFACQTAQDTCSSQAECAMTPGNYCDGSMGTFTCVAGGCAIGRPFLVEGEERVAPLSARADWSDAVQLDLSGVSSQLRERVASAWARIAQMEHASVAAFARFALQLLALGAPAELVELTTQAMADETRHARLAFGIAGQYGAVEVGPSRLNVENSLLESSLVDVVRLVVREGCIGETVAALEAREAAAHAALPQLGELLRRIADDETRHAALAWRFVSWALDQSPALARVLQSELARAELSSAPSPTSADELALLAHGVVPEPLRAELRRAALREVILPCGAALLARAAQHTAENPVVSA